MRIKPLGSKLLIIPQIRKNHKTEAGIEITNEDLSEGVVVEVSDDFKDTISIDDVVIYAANAGQGEYYNGRQCVWIDARSPDKGGDTWAKQIEEKPQIT